MSESKNILRMREAMKRYPCGKVTLKRLAEEAGALIKVRRMLFVDTEAMDRFIESRRVPVK